MIQNERLRILNRSEKSKGHFVLYWMQRAQRTKNNHALQYAIREANRLDLPLVVFFGLTSNFPEANSRHYQFMLEGLAEVEIELQKLGIKFLLVKIEPVEGVIKLAKEAKLVVADYGYLKVERDWKRQITPQIDCSFIAVETDVIVPVGTASTKEEYNAYNLRRKITPFLEYYLLPLTEEEPKHNSLSLETVLDNALLHQDSKIIVPQIPKAQFRGGYSQANKLLTEFIEEKLPFYDQKRNDPTLDYQSNLSPYLHFGQISPLEIACQVKGREGAEGFLEELIVRRELAINFVYYNPNYASYLAIPSWARTTLAQSILERDLVYDLVTLENANTHDEIWNTAQLEMMATGKMSGYLRMYWGKQIIRWQKNPEDAFNIAMYLNNKYQLDGRDPNGFAGVAWCFGKHDRPWPSQPQLGTVRTMTESGIRRKFNINDYLKKQSVYRSLLEKQ